MSSDFSKNLRLLSNHYKSVAELCRKLEINRSQFSQYLNDTTYPSRHTLAKICTFFGVEEYEILLPAYQFSNIISVRPHKHLAHALPSHIGIIEKLQRGNSSDLHKHLGFYFEYYASMSSPGYIVRALVHIAEQEGCVYFDRNLNLTSEGLDVQKTHAHFKGIAFYLNDRLFLVDYESHMENEISQTILFPAHKHRTTYLTGLKLGVSADNRRMPSCSRVIYEVLGRNIEHRKALRSCGLFHHESNVIPDEIKKLVNNSHQDDSFHFEALII